MLRCSAGGNGRARPGVPRPQQRASFREGGRGRLRLRVNRRLRRQRGRRRVHGHLELEGQQARRDRYKHESRIQGRLQPARQQARSKPTGGAERCSVRPAGKRRRQPQGHLRCGLGHLDHRPFGYHARAVGRRCARRCRAAARAERHRQLQRHRRALLRPGTNHGRSIDTRFRCRQKRRAACGRSGRRRRHGRG